jgi:hypothetical protein
MMIPLKFIPNYFLLSFIKCPALGLTGFSAALENRPDQSPQMQPMRQRSQRPFPKSRDSTAVTSAPISETDVHCAHHQPIRYVQSNVISDGFLILESLNCLMTPSPKHALRKNAAAKTGVEIH